jgi:LPXTG-site transpeptidase (sortase) family protein
MAEMVATLASFILIFSSLLLLSNWPAYSLIIQDWIDPQAMAQEIPSVQLDPQLEALLTQQQEIGLKDLEVSSSQDLSLEQLGDLYPSEMRLEVPKVLEGSVPIRNVDVEKFNFADLYASENKIQEALREGVVRYPFTANPDQFGNVFITGHSSYYPWDKGRYKQIFALLHKLEPGDQYFIFFKGKKYTYQVYDIFEIQPDDISVLAQPEELHMSTLMTCTPVGTTLRRLVVQADLVSVQ